MACAPLQLAVALWLSAPVASLTRLDGTEVAYVIEAGAPVPRRLVADFEPPDAVVLAFSSGRVEAFHDLVRAITPEAAVLVVLEAGETDDSLERGLRGLDAEPRAGVQSTGLPVDSPWIRDYGPLQVRDDARGLVWLDASYYDDRSLDEVVPSRLGQQLGLPVLRWSVAIDGGALASNGAGLCVSTTDYARASEISFRSRRDAETLTSALGCPVLVLVPALENEPTKHVDMFAQFLDAGTVALAAYDPLRDPENHARMEVAARAIELGARRLGQKLRVAWIRTPGPVDGEVVSMVNALQLPRSVLVPTYIQVDGSATDAALADWTTAVPDKTVVPIEMGEWVTMGGAAHCAALGIRLSV